MAWIAKELDADVLSVPVEDSWGITGNLTGKDFPVYRFLPHKTKGEGFFLGVLKKRADVLDETPRRFLKTPRRFSISLRIKNFSSSPSHCTHCTDTTTD